MKIYSGVKTERLAILPQPFIDLITDNPLIYDLYVTSIGYASNTKFPFHISHENKREYILLYCTHGRCWVNLKSIKFELSFNQYVIIDTKEIENILPDKSNPCTIYWITFTGIKSQIYAHNNELPIDIPPSVNSRIEDRLELYETIYMLLNSENINIDKLIYANIVFSHFMASLTLVDVFKENNPKIISSSATSIINNIIHYMAENIENNLTIEELANYAGYSKSYFYRKFIEEMEIPPIEYFSHMKINKASIYLIKTNMTISQIAAKLGFNSSEYFSRSFKRILGISPKQFRLENFRL